MSPDFEHFFWGNPGEVESTFMIIDGLENRFLMQSYDHELLYKLTKIMSSKISLNVLDLTHTNISPTESVTDNSVIENWGLENPPPALVQTAPQLFNGIKKFKTITGRKPFKLLQHNTPMADYMVDLQKQLFLFARILNLMSGIGHRDNIHTFYSKNIDHQPTYDYLKHILDISESYDHCCELLCDTNKLTDDYIVSSHTLIILSNLGLYYE